MNITTIRKFDFQKSLRILYFRLKIRFTGLFKWGAESLIRTDMTDIWTQNGEFLPYEEHRLFSYTSKNWRARPLINYQVIIKLISSTKTKTGLNVECEIVKNDYRTGIKISDNQMRKINISRSPFH